MYRATLCMNVLLFAVSAPVFGATLLEMKDGEGGNQKMWIDGERMRIQDSSEPGYMLMHVKEKKMYVVDAEERQVLDMSGVFANRRGGGPQAAKLDVALVKQGKGPKIAGYDTMHYALTVNGEKCSDEYLSGKALSDIAATDAFEALSELAPEGPMGMAQLGPCEAADFQLTEIYKQHGYPLRIVRADGSLESEVTSVVKNAAAPEGGFSLPADYPVVTFGQMMRQAMPPSVIPEGVDPAQMEHMMQEMMKRMEQK